MIQPPPFTAIVMAAGRGTRMVSRLNKMVHPLAGRPVLDHCLATVRAAGATSVIVVVGENRDQIEAHSRLLDGCTIVVQSPPLGTGDAVRVALEAIEGDPLLLISNGDMPLMDATPIRALLRLVHDGQADLALATARVPVPGDLGRIVRNDSGQIVSIAHGPFSPNEEAIDEINVGLYATPASVARAETARLEPQPNGEFYLTDLVANLLRKGSRIASVEVSPDEASGINSRIDLARAEAAMRATIAERHQLSGVTIVDPANTYIDSDVVIGQDTVILPGTHLQGRTIIGRDCTIGPNSIIRSSTIGNGCRITSSSIEDSTLQDQADCGPFAHVRKGAVIGRGVHLGNYAEVKGSVLGPGTKMGHFSYVGDATVGADVNIGAGTITCNWDGVNHNWTTIGDRVFVGSDTMLVAPVTLGDEARTGAGSVVTRDVLPGQTVYGVPARPAREASPEETRTAG